MGMTMTDEQRKVFDKGVQFSIELFRRYIEKNWSKEYLTFEEKEKFFYDIWSFIDSLKSSIALFMEIDCAIEENKISEDDAYFFDEAVRIHTEYMRFCFLEAGPETGPMHLKDYVFSKIPSMQSNEYKDFEEWLAKCS